MSDKPPVDFKTYWNDRYATDDYIFGQGPSQFVKTFASLIPQGAKVFLPADGEGRNSVYLAQLGHEVHAIDYAQAGLDKAQKLAEACDVNVQYQLADLLDFSWPESEYDAVIANMIQFASPKFRARIFEGMKSCLKPGGLVMLHGYSTKQMDYNTGGPGIEENLYTEDLLREAFGDFEIITLGAYETEVNDGTAHVGMSGLIDLIARKPITNS